jgi:integrase
MSGTARRSWGDGAVYATHGCTSRKPKGQPWPCGQTAGDQCPTPRWRGTVEVDDPAGRRRRYLSGPTEAAVRKQVRAAVAAAARGELTATQSPTVREWVEHWLEHIAPDRCKATTLARYRTVAVHWVYPVVGARRLDRLTVDDVRKVYTGMRAAGRVASARQAHALLRRSLRVAQQEGRVARNVAALLDGPAYDRPEVEPLTADEAAAVLAAAVATGAPARWALALCLGMRQGEVLGLAWDDVDLDAGVLRIGAQLQVRRFAHACGDPRQVRGVNRKGDPVVRDVYPCGAAQPIRCKAIPDEQRHERLHLESPKSRKSRRAVPLPPEIVDMLREHRARQRELYVALGTRPGWTTTIAGQRRPVVVDLVFATHAGRPVEPRADSDAWHALLKAAGVPRAKLHDARHTAATVMLELGVEPKMVSEILGHSSTYFTQDTYQHWVPSLAVTATSAMSGRLLGTASATSAAGTASATGTARARRGR